MSRDGNADAPVKLVDVRANAAFTDLVDKGWAVGPAAEPDAWRRAVKARARRAGLRVRTGEARPWSGGDSRPWAITVAGHKSMSVAMGGYALATLGRSVVEAAVQSEGNALPE